MAAVSAAVPVAVPMMVPGDGQDLSCLRFLMVYWDIEMGPEPAPGDTLRGRFLELE